MILRAQDPAWSLIGEFPRDSEISERLFVAATTKLAAWSKDQKQNCRFFSIFSLPVKARSRIATVSF
jgi:hypothetical protein